VRQAGVAGTLLVEEAFEEPVPAYVCGSGPRVWLIAADGAVVEDLLAQLP